MDSIEGKLRKAGLVKYDPVNLRAGDSSNYYIDVKKVHGDPKLLKQISRELWGKIDKRTTCIAAAGHGGLPLAVTLSLEHNLPLVLVRDKPKNHGLSGLIDGHIPKKDDFVSIVDDVFTTGSSLRKTIKALGDIGATILGCYVVVKRGNGKLPVPLTYLVEAKSLL